MNPTTLASSQPNPKGLTLAGGYLYWANNTQVPSGSVARMPVGGGSVSVIAPNQSYPSRIAVDGGRVAADGPPAETVTDELLARVFKVTSAVSRTPPAGVPFVLPHHCATLR